MVKLDRDVADGNGHGVEGALAAGVEEHHRGAQPVNGLPADGSRR